MLLLRAGIQSGPQFSFGFGERWFKTTFSFVPVHVIDFYGYTLYNKNCKILMKRGVYDYEKNSTGYSEPDSGTQYPDG